MPGTISKPIVVIDTNVLLSALLFQGKPSEIRLLWKSGRIIPKANRLMMKEYARVLTYGKFKLTAEEISAILSEEILPFFVMVKTWSKDIPQVPKDPDDSHFLGAALEAAADVLISCDNHLIELNGKFPFPILTPTEFLDGFSSHF